MKMSPRLTRAAPPSPLFPGATREEMRDARLPLAYRDSCAHLLIPLNKCREATWYAPWKCVASLPPPPGPLPSPLLPPPRASSPSLTPPGHQDERHSYEKCQYYEFKKRVAKMDQLREERGGARVN